MNIWNYLPTAAAIIILDSFKFSRIIFSYEEFYKEVFMLYYSWIDLGTYLNDF